MEIYLASPLGFSEVTKLFLDKLIKQLENDGHVVFNPFAQTKFSKKLKFLLEIPKNELTEEYIIEIKQLNFKIGEMNKKMLDHCDVVLAVLDGSDVDSGTASEIGYVASRNIPIYGYRNDFRKAGDNEYLLVNLQIQFWIENSGGKIFSSFEDIKLSGGHDFEKEIKSKSS